MLSPKHPKQTFCGKQNPLQNYGGHYLERLKPPPSHPPAPLCSTLIFCDVRRRRERRKCPGSRLPAVNGPVLKVKNADLLGLWAVGFWSCFFFGT